MLTNTPRNGRGRPGNAGNASHYDSILSALFIRRATIVWLAVATVALTMMAMSTVSVAESSADESVYTFSPRFGTRKVDLGAADRERLDAIAREWQGQKGLVLEVTGHTDNVPIAPKNRGEFADNQVLSEARARSVAGYLANKLGVPAERIRVVGMGDRQPIASNATTEGRARNRRVDVRVRVQNAVVAPAPVMRGASGSAVLARAQSFD